MNKNNDKQRTTHEHYWEPKKKLWTNQGKTKENHRKTNEKPKKDNEKQWKTKDNFASILSYLLPGIFGPCFFEVFIFNGERNKRHFWGKKGILRCLGSCMFTKPCKYAVNCIVSCICASNGVELFFCLLFFWGFYGGKNTGRRELRMPFST